MIFRPRSSTSVSTAVSPANAACTAASISSPLNRLSTVNSRGECCTPILISTAVSPAVVPLRGLLARPIVTVSGSLGPRYRTLSGAAEPEAPAGRELRVVGPQREALDAPPHERGHQVDRLIAADPVVVRGPGPGGDLCDTGQGGAEQPALGVRQSGV